MIRNLRFTFLGTGTSAGVPVIGCDCEVCRSSDTRDQRLRCSSMLQFTDATDQERVILIDASPDLRQQALRHNLQRCDAILFTHNHVDHTFGLDEVRRFNITMGHGIDIYAEPPTMEHLYRVYKHIFDREANVNDSFVATLQPFPLQVGKPLNLYGLCIEPLRLLHGRLPILGFRIEEQEFSDSILPLAYCTDVSSIPPETWPKLTGLRHLILDMLRPRHHPTHMTVDQAIAAASQIEADRTWFVHMTHNIIHAELNTQLPESMALAYDGLVLESTSQS